MGHYANGGAAMNPSARASKLAVPVTARDHVRGPDSARVTLVEYGDYQCPHCALAHPVVKQVRAQLGDRLRFVFRHFPLAQVHPMAVKAAEAAEAAGAQEKFWEMHDLLFERQRELGEIDDAGFAKWAAELGLDTERFARELSSRVYHPRIQEDFLGGMRSGVKGTPAFFINGVRHTGGFDINALLPAVEAAAATG